MNNCPVCNGRAIGKVGSSQYYCWDCFLEFSHSGGQLKVYEVDEDGSLVDYAYSDNTLTN